MAFQSPFPWNQAGYFLVVKACKELWRSVLEKSQSSLSLRVSFREQRWHLPHKGGYRSHLDLGCQSAKAVLLTSPSKLLVREWICSAAKIFCIILVVWIKESGSKPERGKSVTAVVEQCAFCIQLFELGHKAKLRQCCKVCEPISFIHLSYYLSTSVSTSFSSCPVFHQTLDLNSSDTSHSIPNCTGSTITRWQMPLSHGKKLNTLGTYHNYFDLLLFWQVEHLSGNKAVWKTMGGKQQNPKNKEGNHGNA